MRIDVEIGASSNFEMVRAALKEPDSGGLASLPVLCGGDLCALGLRSPKITGLEQVIGWSERDTAKRERFMEDRVQSMIKRGLLIEETPGRGYYPGACFTASAALGILLAALRSPSFVIATNPTTRLHPVRYFALGDWIEPVIGFVQEVPDRSGSDSLIEDCGLLSEIFCYRLYLPVDAASYLARWILKPTGPDALRRRFPRGVSVIRPDSVAAYRFTTRRDGETALAEGPRLRTPVVCGEVALRMLMLDLFEWGSRPYTPVSVTA
jgi:hypothetical protein